MTERFANNAASKLNGAISSGSTSLVVVNASTFPTLPQFRLLLGTNPLTAEIVLVTGISGTTFTILRGQEGTTAIGWADQADVTHILTAGAVTQVITGGGDLSGTVENATIAKIHGKTLSASLSSIGSTQDGYVLTWNNGLGDWEASPLPPTAIVISGRIFLFTALDSEISTYQEIQDATTGADADIFISPSAGVKTLIKSYVTLPGEPNTTVIPAGIWEFSFYRYVNDAAGTTILTFDVYKRNLIGIETLLFTVDSLDINDTSAILESVNYAIESNINILATDRIVIKVSGTASAASKDIHFVYDGVTHPSHAHTTIVGGAFALGGDVVGTTSANTVAKIRGNSVQAVTYGAAQDGYVFSWTNSDGYIEMKPIISTMISGTVPVSKLTAGLSAQVLLNNSTPTPTWTTLAGDMTVGNTGITSVDKIKGNSVATQILNASQDGYRLAWSNTDGYWKATQDIDAPLSGDVTGPETATVVAKIKGNPVATQTLGAAQDGYKLAWSNIDGYWRGIQDIELPLSGDVTGPETANVVTKIRGNSIAIQTLGVAQDGYVLAWDNLDGYWYAKPGGAVSTIELSFVSGNYSTTLSTFQRVGGRSIDMSSWPSLLNGLTRIVSFNADIQKTSGATSAEVQLFDVTNGVSVTNTDLTSTSLTLTTVSANNLTVGISSGNIRNNTATQYETQLKMNGGGASDAAFLTNARLLISYAVPPAITSLNYVRGDTAGGGQPVFINGSGFAAGCTCTLGTVTFISAVQISVVLNANAPGIIDVIVTNPNGLISTGGTGAFEYWTPAQITGIITYVDSNKGLTTSGADVTNWHDQSSNAYDFSGIFPYPQTTSSIFGTLPSMRFVGGGGNYFNKGSATFLFATGISAFWVGKWTVNDTTEDLPTYDVPMPVISNGYSGYPSMGMYGDTIAYKTGAAQITRGSGLNDGTTRLVGWTQPNGTGNLKAYIGVTQLGTTDSTTVYDSTSAFQRIGAGLSTNDSFRGDLGAVIVLSQVISANDLIKLNTWSQQRFGTP